MEKYKNLMKYEKHLIIILMIIFFFNALPGVIEKYKSSPFDYARFSGILELGPELLMPPLMILMGYIFYKWISQKFKKKHSA